MSVPKLSVPKLLVLLAALLLLAAGSRAQGRPVAALPGQPTRQVREVRVSVTLPKAVGIVRDYGRILLSRKTEKDRLRDLTTRFREKTSQPVVEVTVAVPRNWLTRKLGLAE